MIETQLSGQLFAEMVRGGAANLRKNADIVNDLNVFPIPDGDTGENMSLTMEGGISTIAHTDSDSLESVTGELAHGMLLSARGNSGVILSQFFDGIAKGFQNVECADMNEVCKAFRYGVQKAYDSVINPTEGTILTVARESVEYACSRVCESSDIETFLSDLIDEMHRSLNRTPEMLEVLKEAGVIDSGGAGLTYVMEGMDKVLHGETITMDQGTVPVTKELDTSSFTKDSVMEFGYCTEFLLQLQTSKVNVDAFDVQTVIDYLKTVGNSIVAFKTDSIIKVHVHTMTPGKVLDHCQQYGEFLTMKVENMCIQHSEANIENRYTSAKAETKHKAYGVVAVASGDGIRDTFLQLGADVVVNGGQTMNPSAEDFLEAFDEVKANTIIVMPNNSNIILAARQAAELYQKADVQVLESKTLGDGYAALSMMDFDTSDTQAIMENLNSAMNGVVTAEITRSVRDANLGGLDIKKDDYIGFIGKEMLTASPDKGTTVNALLDKMDFANHEVLIAISGIDATQDEVMSLREYMKKTYPSAEVFVIDGKQEYYDFILVAE